MGGTALGLSEVLSAGDIPPSSKHLIAAFVSGFLLSRVTAPFHPIEIGPFDLHLSFFAFPVAIVSSILTLEAPPDRIDVRSTYALSGAAGVLWSELVFLVIRADRGAPYGPTSGLVGGAALGVIFSVVAISLYRSREAAPDEGWRLTPTRLGLLALIQVAGLVVFRLSQTVLSGAGIPNASRSFIVAGHEIHHIATGTLLLVLGGLVATYRGNSDVRGWTGFLLVGTATIMVLDQLLYYFYDRVTDSRYFGSFSVSAALLGVSVFTAFLLFRTYSLGRSGGVRDGG